MSLKKAANVESPKVGDPEAESVLDPVAAPVAEPVKTEEAGKAVVAAPAHGNLPAHQESGTGTKAALATLANAGFEGLDLDFSSFTSIVLNDGQFECSNGKTLPHEGFDCRITRTRKKYAFRSSHAEQKDVEVVYSYDMNDRNVPDSAVAKKIAEWREGGHDCKEVKEYIEVWAMMENDGTKDREMDGELVMLSIPPTSKGRISGFLMTQQMKQLLPSDFITRVYRGEKVTRVDFPYYPWAFRLAAE